MKIAICCLSLLISLSVAAQCTNFYYLQDNKTVEMSIYNRKGDLAGKNVYKVSGVRTSGGTTTGTINSEMFDKKGKSIMTAVNHVSCSGGVMKMDLKMFMPQQQAEQFNKADAKAEQVYVEYPASMNPGDKLKDATMTVTVNSSGLEQTITLELLDRQVLAKESVTTTAGTWDCFKISQKTKMRVKTGPIGIPFNFDVTEWYAPGFGVVKTQSKTGNTEITAIK